MADIGNLAPWDAMPYFFTPTMTTYTLGTGALLIAPANPNRVGLIISTVDGSANCWVGPSPLVATNNGVPINQTQPPLMLTHRDFGPLTQVEWYAAASVMGIHVCVIELVLAKLPSGDKPDV